MALDQVLFAPLFIGIFYTMTGVLEGLDKEGLKEKLDRVNFKMNRHSKKQGSRHDSLLENKV